MALLRALSPQREKGDFLAMENTDPMILKPEMSMSSKSTGNGSKGSSTIAKQAKETGGAMATNAAREEDIRRRAYEIFLERGEEPGHELDDWLRAERELEDTMRSRAQKA
jgi:hypothetical protein